MCKDKKLKGWKFKARIITGEVWEKGDERVLYDPRKKEILHQYTV